MPEVWLVSHLMERLLRHFPFVQLASKTTTLLKWQVATPYHQYLGSLLFLPPFSVTSSQSVMDTSYLQGLGHTSLNFFIELGLNMS